MRIFSKRTALLILTGSLLFAFMRYVYGTVYVRLVIDDYCFLNIGRQYGVLGSVTYYYYFWSGRFTGVFMTVSALLGHLPAEIIFTSLLLVIWWWGVLAVLLKIARYLEWTQPRVYAVLATSMLTLATLGSAFNVLQSVYWTSGQFLYLAPLAGLPVLIRLILCQPVQRRSTRLLILSLCALLAFAASGLLEIWGIAQTLLLAMACVVSVRRHALKIILPGLLVSLVASGIGLTVVLVAPGNFVRLTYFARPDFLQTMVTVIESPLVLLSATFGAAPVTLSALIVIPCLLSVYGTHKVVLRARVALLIIPAVAWLIIMAYFSLPYYATGNPPPERIEMIPQFLLDAGLMTWGYLLGSTLRGRTHAVTMPEVFPYLIGGLLVLIALTFFANVSSVLSRLESYALAWDKREKDITPFVGQPVTLTVTPLPNIMRLEDLSSDSTFWVNVCMAKYYNVQAVKQNNG